MLKRGVYIILIAFFATGIISCNSGNEHVKIGASIGVGEAVRWKSEKIYMEEKAKELGADIEVRLNTLEGVKTQEDDCKELIDSGIDVLILTPHNGSDVSEVIDYAKKNDVKVVNYARAILNHDLDLFVGFDSYRIGENLGQYLSETVDKGDYIILRGDKDDNNAKLLYEGAMRNINPIKDDIKIILDKEVPAWSTEEAKRMVKEAVRANDNRVDAILALNDKLAGAAAEALKELNVATPAIITGTDAELDAAKRIVSGRQAVTVYLDLKELACTAVNEAYNLAAGEDVAVNTKFDNNTDKGVDADLISGKVVTKENLDRVLIEGGIYTKEEVYGSN